MKFTILIKLKDFNLEDKSDNRKLKFAISLLVDNKSWKKSVVGKGNATKLEIKNFSIICSFFPCINIII